MPDGSPIESSFGMFTNKISEPSTSNLNIRAREELFNSLARLNKSHLQEHGEEYIKQSDLHQDCQNALYLGTVTINTHKHKLIKKGQLVTTVYYN